MKEPECNADEILKELKDLVDELKIAVGRDERLVLGMRVKRVDSHQVATLLPAIERLLERYHTTDEEVDQWKTLVNWRVEMNYVQKQALLVQINGDSKEFVLWLLQKGKQIMAANSAPGKLFRSVSAFDHSRCSYVGLDATTEEAALYKQFRREKEYKQQQLNAPPKPRDYSNLNKELFQSDSSTSLLEQLNALKAEVNRLKGGQQS